MPGLNSSTCSPARCDIVTPTVVQNDNGPSTVGVYALRVRFSDATTEPISRVTFTLDDGTKVIDAGTFSPGIAIDHALDLNGTNATSCTVTAVQFADGATWNAN